MFLKAGAQVFGSVVLLGSNALASCVNLVRGSCFLCMPYDYAFMCSARGSSEVMHLKTCGVPSRSRGDPFAKHGP